MTWCKRLGMLSIRNPTTLMLPESFDEDFESDAALVEEKTAKEEE